MGVVAALRARLGVRSAIVLCLLALQACDPGDFFQNCQPPAKESSFDDVDNTGRVRDNYLAGGYFYDTLGEANVFAAFGGVYHQNTGQHYPVDLDYLLTYDEGDFYSFIMRRTWRAIDLVPGQPNVLRLQYADAQPNEYFAETVVTMDPNVAVIPVHTWYLVPEGNADTLVTSRLANWIFDRAPGSRQPTEIIGKPFTAARPDEIWAQCNIQFRHQQHHIVEVPSCWTSGVIVQLDDDCTPYVTNDECDPDPELNNLFLCDDQPVNQCALKQYVEKFGHQRPNAFNVYFVWSIHNFEWEDPIRGVGCWPYHAFVSLALYGADARTIEHEIGHVMGIGGHRTDTLMGRSVTYRTNTLTPAQRQEAWNDSLLIQHAL